MIQVGKPVQGQDFIGRTDEINEIKQYLMMGQSVVIIAPRRFGKTSLVIEVLNQLKKEKRYVGFVDIFENASLSQLSRNIIEEVLNNHGLKKAYQQAKGSILSLLKNVKLKAVIEEFEFLLGIEDPNIEVLEQFGGTIDFIDAFAKKANKNMTMALDEYGDILKFDKSKEIIKSMRSKIQKQKNTAYIFSGSYESIMDSLFVDRKSPFYRLARRIELSYLKFDDVKKYMVRRLKKHKIKYKESLIDDTIDFLKGHPYYCQLALQQMYLYHMTKGKAPSFDQLLEIIINTDKSYLEKIWEEIYTSKEAVFILKHLSTAPKGIYAMAAAKKINASRTLKKLEGLGIIYNKEGGYYFYDPIFEYWIANRIHL